MTTGLMIRSLCPVFHLTQSLMCTSCSLSDRPGKQFIIHEMEQEQVARNPPSPDQFHTSKIDFSVTFDRIFDGTAGFCKCRWIQDHNIIFLIILRQLRSSSKTSSQINLTPSLQTHLTWRSPVPWRTASSEASTPVTSLALPIPAFSAKRTCMCETIRTLASLHNF